MGCERVVWDPDRFHRWPHMGQCGRPTIEGSNYCKDHQEEDCDE